MVEFLGSQRQTFPRSDQLGYPACPGFPPSWWRISATGYIRIQTVAPTNVRLNLNVWHPISVWVTFSFLEACDRLHDVPCSCFTCGHLTEGVKRLLGSETLSHESPKKREVSGWQHDKQEGVLSKVLRFITFSRTFCLPLSLSKLKLLIHLGLLRCRALWGNIFIHSSCHWRSRESQLRPSSSVGQLKSFWQIAESEDLEKSGSRSCVFISVSHSSKR